MKRNYDDAVDFFEGFGKVLNKAVGKSFTIEGLADMEDEEFELYRDLSKSYKEFSALTISLVDQMDEQTKMLEDLQRDMKRLVTK